MFPLVQNFPENYLIHISTDSGECILPVWAHSILGLTVLILGEGHRPDLKLGQGDPQIVVDISVANAYIYPASITLLDSSKEPHEELITISPDLDESIIDGTWKIPAKGYGKSILEFVCDKYGFDLLGGNSEASRAIVDEMALVASANAQMIAKSLVRNKPVGMVSTPAQPAFTIKCVTEQRQILRAAKFLFERPELEDEEISVYQTSTPLHQNTPLPSSVAGALQVARRTNQEWNANFFWKPIVKAVQALSLLLLAFAHVRNLDECGALPLCGSYTLLQQHGLITPFAPTSGPDVHAEINVENASWFNVIVLLLFGHIVDVNHYTTCLISDRGWSIYMNTFRTPDPAFIDPGFFRIQPGVPVRNGVRKHAILDGPATGLDSSRWNISNTSGQNISLSCFDNVVFGNNEHGERRDAFVLNLRLVMLEHPNANALLTRRTGTEGAECCTVDI
ncbi:hypothetical protein N7G274_003461 [Stereocaulon virgatum]|uniref:Uncharacterized protein n=1 Tax=Stereocaulon virgatum TaxID=373712 RepID=A0ABR4AGH4_9LECA